MLTADGHGSRRQRHLGPEKSGGGSGGGNSGESGEPAGKSIFTLLAEAFAIYRLNAKALLLTCALLFVPASIAKSWALSSCWRRPCGPALT